MAMFTQEYRTNRARFPRAEVARYQSFWVAFSADGSRIVARAEVVERLEEQIASEGHDPQQLVLEWLAGPEDDGLFGVNELGFSCHSLCVFE
jgi:hypothetical protein